MGYRIAVVGATGNVGREMLDILAERQFPADEVTALASRRSQGVEVSYGERVLKVKALEHHDFSRTDICLMSAGSAVSKEWSPKLTSEPWLRREASATTSSAGNARSARMSSISRPTLPVAPTTATL